MCGYIFDSACNVISYELNLFSEEHAKKEQKTLNDALQPMLGETNYEFWGVVDCVTDTKLQTKISITYSSNG
jgi:hypothetical protein